MKPRFDETVLADYLARLGWPVEPCGERTWCATHPTGEGDVSVFLRLSDHWLIATVVPFLATRGELGFELSRWLLRMNRDMPLRKFTYDEDGDVLLTVEVPTESLDFGEVEKALVGLVEDVIRHRATLRRAARV